MTELILHHYELSPFSEKVRRLLAFKGLAWSSVRAPAIMPKPDLVALTGGYRKIPVLQIGNHVYCDSSRIADLLDEREPSPPLYPSPLARSFAEWADSALFDAIIPMITRPTRFDDLLRWLTPEEQQGFLEDRKAMRKDALRLTPSAKTLLAHFGVYAARLEATLGAQTYVLGAAPCIADFAVYHSMWSVQHLAPERIEPYPNVRAWMERIAAMPDPRITPLTSERALQIARDASPDWTPPEPFGDASGLAEGAEVVVRANDYGREPAAGELVHSSAREIVLRREDVRAGTVYVHFPRVGFEVTAAVSGR